jgi:uncharacterized membrane protein (UPF0127 family)/phosphatidylglycerophosphate synthase
MYFLKDVINIRRLIIPNIITYSRIILGLVLICFASLKMIFFFLVFYVLALILDILDGYLARRLSLATEFGAKLDIIADNFILLCLAASFYIFRKEILLNYSLQIAMLLSYFIIIQLISIAAKKKLIFMRTLAANIAATVFPFVILVSLFVEEKLFIYIYIVMMYYSLTEKLLLTLSGENKKMIFMIKKKKLIFLFLILVFFLTAVSFYFMFSSKTDKICFADGYCAKVEIRDTYEGRALGLMFRESLKEDEAMLFIFDDISRSPFWMKNMKISIDIIFIDKDKRIVSISRNAVPCTKPDNECELYNSGGEYLYVVETIAGFSDKHSLMAGQEVEILLGRYRNDKANI